MILGNKRGPNRTEKGLTNKAFTWKIYQSTLQENVSLKTGKDYTFNNAWNYFIISMI